MTDSVRNWSGSVRFTPSRVVTPTSELEVAALLATAAERGQQVKVIGAGHSFTPLAATDAADSVLMRLDALSGIVGHDEASGEATLWGGTRIRDIAGLLAPFGRGLANMGDIDAQAIAGAVSTGTHGTGISHTGYSGQVTGLRLALPDGRLVDVSEAQDPELFQAARVGLGAIGIITRVRIRTVPAFNLAAVETTEPVEHVLESFLERARATDHLEFYWFPGTRRATVKHNHRMPDDDVTSPMSAAVRLVNRELLGNGVFGAACRAASVAPALAPAVRGLASRLMAGDRFSDASHTVFVAPRRVRFEESEYAMPVEAFGEVVREAERAIVSSGLQVTFPMEVRLAAADDTWLGTASGRESVYVAVHRYHREAFEPLLAAVEPVFAAHQGRPHWGKRHTLGAERFRALYRHFDDFRSVRERVDPSGVLLNRHLRQVLGA